MSWSTFHGFRDPKDDHVERTVRPRDLAGTCIWMQWRMETRYLGCLSTGRSSSCKSCSYLFHFSTYLVQLSFEFFLKSRQTIIDGLNLILKLRMYGSESFGEKVEQSSWQFFSMLVKSQTRQYYLVEVSFMVNHRDSSLEVRHQNCQLATFH